MVCTIGQTPVLRTIWQELFRDLSGSSGKNLEQRIVLPMGPATETVGFLQSLRALGTMLLFRLLQ